MTQKHQKVQTQKIMQKLTILKGGSSTSRPVFFGNHSLANEEKSCCQPAKNLETFPRLSSILLKDNLIILQWFRQKAEISIPKGIVVSLKKKII